MKIAVVGATGLVGAQVVALAAAAGHEVVALSKETGTDVLVADGLAERLTGVEALIDVTQSPSLEQAASTAFFEQSAANLGGAATAAGVGRYVVLSIIGVDTIAATGDAGTGFDGYYTAKFAQEEAARAHAPGVHVVRSAQFHDISRQAIGWGRDGSTATVSDLTIQPLAVADLAGLLLEVATGERDGVITQVAGPGVQHLAELSTKYAAHVGDAVEIVAAPASAAVRDGILLPGDQAVIVGPSYDEWLATVPVPARA